MNSVQKVISCILSHFSDDLYKIRLKVVKMVKKIFLLGRKGKNCWIIRKDFNCQLKNLNFNNLLNGHMFLMQDLKLEEKQCKQQFFRFI